jgi:hypothetical protein
MTVKGNDVTFPSAGVKDAVAEVPDWTLNALTASPNVNVDAEMKPLPVI